MNVHIILMDTGYIIPRMARWLAEDLGWSVGDRPDPAADVNYYMPYLAFDEATAPRRGATMAWFTHFEHYNHWKVNKWALTAGHVDLALTTSPVELQKIGRSHRMLVSAGVDLDEFKIGDRQQNELPIVGIVGEGQPRKGPHRIVDLFYSGIECAVRIIGNNWPFPAQLVEAGQMADFYNSIDVLLCTSLIEGIPAPILEALACGTKVVIPSDVGICDLLPERAGIRHFTEGPGSAPMLEALRTCLADAAHPEALRREAELWPRAAWVHDHAKAAKECVRNHAILSVQM